MKLNQFFALIIAIFLFFGCNQQPIGSTLLTSGKSTDSTEDTTSTTDDGALDIQPDNSAMTVNVDDSDKVEITGNCKDLDRKNNRILVEVFAGEDETVEPYISNSLSDRCRNIPYHAGIYDADPLDKCFWVTKGTGLIEDANLETQRSFPQCHNGRFGFSVKLGQILGAVSAPNSKYTVRFKLRSLEGILSDSVFSRVTIIRQLNTPVIDSASFSAISSPLQKIQCKIKTSPARFNFGIQYKLTRSFTDAANTAGLTEDIYSGATTISPLDGTSVFSWDDYSIAGSAFKMLQGVTYKYTLTSTDTNLNYTTNYVLNPTATSSEVSCVTESLRLNATPPTPSPGTCYMLLETIANPNYIGGAGLVSYQWAYSTTSANWVGTDFSAQTGFSPAIAPTCANTTACTENGLTAGTTYYFAVRETSGIYVGKWSNVMSCRPP